MAKAGTFTKGPDPRRWTKGRPNNFDGLSELTRAIAHEVATKKGGEKVEIDGHLVTITEAVIRQWLQSGEFAKQKAALEIAYGKVPDNLNLGGTVKHEHKHDLSKLDDSELEQLDGIVAKLTGDQG